MNAIMDLTARAVSFITAIQSTLLKGAIISGKENNNISILNTDPENFESRFKRFVELEKNSEDSFSIKSSELVWISKKKIEDKFIAAASVEYAVFLAVNLVSWIAKNRQKLLDNLSEKNGGYPTPFKWRKAISKILYSQPGERIEIACKLQYLPIQIVLASGQGHLDVRDQRILQTWMITEPFKTSMLNSDERELLGKFASFSKRAMVLLRNDDLLLYNLLKKNVPLAFEQVFASELKEIEKNRERRISEQHVATSGNQKHKSMVKDEALNDPYEKAKQMGGLSALAFSGGGIRSATFNLGILQGLARKNLLQEFDYLSTVSGGGYIGSWLAAWIKRDGSVVKVSNRLCPDKSPEPLGEELRPIKWLRMFSNYFAPNVSIMSADSWTVGITWLRNTLLSQVIILFMLLSVLFFGDLLFVFWSENLKDSNHDSLLSVSLYSIGFMLPIALLAGFGMHAYHSDNIRWLGIKRKHTNTISALILAIAFTGAYFISAWLSSPWHTIKSCDSFLCKIKIVAPAAIVTFISLMLVAWFGNYLNCIKGFFSHKSAAFQRIIAGSILVGTALLTTVVGVIFMAVGWMLLQKINASTSLSQASKNQIEFIIGFPLVLEAFSITLVARMAFLGRYFPDERREWWGRLGAIIHRTSFLWILISASALLGQQYTVKFFKENLPSFIVATGGWTVLILAAVKAAFNSKTAGNKESKGALPSFVNILGLVGPYLFALGLLIFLPALIMPIRQLVEHIIYHDASPSTSQAEATVVYIFVGCFLIALLLSMQVGVNEFSMHHFYRNRLVRAYLGATRRYADRQKSANPFTGFDKRDDEKLSRMTNEEGYYGPYPVLNTALNASQVTDLDRQDRKAESFIFSPLFCGFDFSMVKASADINTKSYDYAYRPTKEFAFANNGPGIGTAMAISGAAINPNQGFHSSAATAFLLTIFNVQMGWWIGNPRKSTWKRAEPRFGLGYIFYNLVGKTNTRSDYVALSDGGHFDNMGLYEMVRRKCMRIVLCDAEQDNDFTCEGFANAIRRCRIDFGAEIKIDISKIVNRKEGRYSEAHFAVGEISYAGHTTAGKLLYIKSSITGNEPVDIYEYAEKNKSFPQQTTADQFFDEEQFESYRKLGLWIADNVFTA